jgi:putative tricarboxylic transport membrane protein
VLRVSDLVSGLAVASLGALIVLQAQTFPSVGASPISPSFYPGLIGTVLMACGAALAITSLVKGGAMPLGVMPDWLRRPGNILAVLSIPAAIVAYGTMSPSLGFLAASALVMLGLLLCFQVKLLWSVAIAIALPTMLHVVFVVLMRVPLPFGLIEAMLR